MEVKWFFVLFGVLFTSTILLGQLFIGIYLSEQEKTSQNKAVERFDNSSIVHKFIYDNVTGLRADWNTGLQPLLEQIPNATQSRLDQQIHYNQTAEDFDRIKQVLDIKLQDHVTLGALNQSLVTMAEILNGTGSSTNGSLIYIPIPVDNTHNQTGDNNNICDPYMVNKTTYHPYCKPVE